MFSIFIIKYTEPIQFNTSKKVVSWLSGQKMLPSQKIHWKKHVYD